MQGSDGARRQERRTMMSRGDARRGNRAELVRDMGEDFVVLVRGREGELGAAAARVLL